MSSSAPIGVFDSGMGGLTVVREMMSQLPNESIIYFGDTARVPYGPKSPDTVLRYSREITSFLKKEGVKALVVACNTATAHALPALREEFDFPIIG
ncbi:MAG TPA: aspartate/glutamate racemase family protein, partial [Gemmatimonadaceae bacterium]|nr:aspartate/glutamate racemase family protein [Gemmatimonadaceae bacterium]